MIESGNAKPGERLEQLHAQPQSGEAQLYSCDIADSAGNASRNGSAPSWRAWLGYRRGRDFDQVPNNEGTGQDNAALRADDRYIVGVVSDGVSQSFYGDLAATVVTERLLEGLWQYRAKPPNAAIFQEWLLGLEAEIADAARAFPLPARLLEAVREELESQRVNLGSKAVMAAFILDRHQEGGLLNAYQVGDPYLYAYLTPEKRNSGTDPNWVVSSHSSSAQPIVHLQCDPDGRLSSLGNTRRNPTYGVLTGVCGVALHSDGVAHDWGATLANLDSAEALRADLEVWAGKDDACFVVALAPALIEQRPLAVSPPTLAREKIPVYVPPAPPSVQMLVRDAGGMSSSNPPSVRTNGISDQVASPPPLVKKRRRKVNAPAAALLLLALAAIISAGGFALFKVGYNSGREEKAAQGPPQPEIKATERNREMLRLFPDYAVGYEDGYKVGMDNFDASKIQKGTAKPSQDRKRPEGNSN